MMNLQTQVNELYGGYDEPTDSGVMYTFPPLLFQSQKSILDFMDRKKQPRLGIHSQHIAATPPPLNDTTDYEIIKFQAGMPQIFTCGDKHLLQLVVM